MGGSASPTNGIYVTIGLLLILTIAGGFFWLDQRSQQWHTTADRIATALARQDNAPAQDTQLVADANQPPVNALTDAQMEQWAAVIVKAIDEGFARAAANADERDAALLAAVAETIDQRLAAFEETHPQVDISREQLEATIFDRVITLIEQQIDQRMAELQRRQSRITATRTQIRQSLKSALEAYHATVGHYPTAQDGGLYALFEPPPDELVATTWKGPYVRSEAAIFDAWGNPLVYECPGQYNPQAYDLASAGPDGQFGTADDITNWVGTAAPPADSTVRSETPPGY